MRSGGPSRGSCVVGRALELVRANAQRLRRQRHFAQKAHQPRNEATHREHEERRHEARNIRAEERAHEQHRNDHAHQQCREREQGDAAVDVPRAPRQPAEILSRHDMMLAGEVDDAILEHPRAIDDATKAIGEHDEHRGDTREQKDRGDGGLDNMRDGFGAGLLEHAQESSRRHRLVNRGGQRDETD